MVAVDSARDDRFVFEIVHKPLTTELPVHGPVSQAQVGLPIGRVVAVIRRQVGQVVAGVVTGLEFRRQGACLAQGKVIGQPVLPLM